MEIETASNSDVPGIIEVEKQTWIDSYPNDEFGITESDVRARFGSEFTKKRAEDMRIEMEDTDHRYRVVKVNGLVVAYSHLLKEADFGDLVEVYVLPEHQGRGIGGALIRDGLNWLGDDKPIRLEVAVYNPAIAIYEHYGFVKRPDLKQAEGEDWNILPSGKRIPVIFMERPDG